jgi:hypothetical protein
VAFFESQKPTKGKNPVAAFSKSNAFPSSFWKRGMGGAYSGF